MLSTVSVHKDFESRFLSAGGYQDGTWERSIPQLTEQYVHLFHLTRYRYASEHICQLGEVLDVGCGAGYGAALLARSAGHVTAIDVSQEAISFAQEYYPADNLDYLCGDWRVAFDDRPYNAIVSFEFLEHIDEQEQFVGAVRNQLADKGIFIVSTPNERLSSGQNPYHRRELTIDEFEKLLRSYFGSIMIFGQYVRPEFYTRQKKLLDYIEMQSFLPKWIRQLRRPYASKQRQVLIDEMIGLTEADIIISAGEYARENARILIAVCKP